MKLNSRALYSYWPFPRSGDKFRGYVQMSSTFDNLGKSSVLSIMVWDKWFHIKPPLFFCLGVALGKPVSSFGGIPQSEGQTGEKIWSGHSHTFENTSLYRDAGGFRPCASPQALCHLKLLVTLSWECISHRWLLSHTDSERETWNTQNQKLQGRESGQLTDLKALCKPPPVTRRAVGLAGGLANTSLCRFSTSAVQWQLHFIL